MLRKLLYADRPSVEQRILLNMTARSRGRQPRALFGARRGCVYLGAGPRALPLMCLENDGA